MVFEALAQALRGAARTEDIECRWGGEDFLLICPNLELRKGGQMTERMRRSIASLRLTAEEH
jgi:diguanylate cyclase (GGDEF)-like protein